MTQKGVGIERENDFGLILTERRRGLPDGSPLSMPEFIWPVFGMC
jgi:hypothetical protein